MKVDDKIEQQLHTDTIVIVRELLGKITDISIPNTATLAASSIPETARTNVGIPFETP